MEDAVHVAGLVFLRKTPHIFLHLIFLDRYLAVFDFQPVHNGLKGQRLCLISEHISDTLIGIFIENLTLFLQVLILRPLFRKDIEGSRDPADNISALVFTAPACWYRCVRLRGRPCILGRSVFCSLSLFRNCFRSRLFSCRCRRFCRLSGNCPGLPLVFLQRQIDLAFEPGLQILIPEFCALHLRLDPALLILFIIEDFRIYIFLPRNRQGIRSDRPCEGVVIHGIGYRHLESAPAGQSLHHGVKVLLFRVHTLLQGFAHSLPVRCIAQFRKREPQDFLVILFYRDLSVEEILCQKLLCLFRILSRYIHVVNDRSSQKSAAVLHRVHVGEASSYDRCNKYCCNSNSD